MPPSGDARRLRPLLPSTDEANTAGRKDSNGCHQARPYEIRVAGVLDGRWAAWFDGLQISGQGEETVICGLLADQPALHGLLAKIRDLGLGLISVRRLDTGQAL
jgi:hypothetical protein